MRSAPLRLATWGRLGSFWTIFCCAPMLRVSSRTNENCNRVRPRLRAQAAQRPARFGTSSRQHLHLLGGVARL